MTGAVLYVVESRLRKATPPDDWDPYLSAIPSMSRVNAFHRMQRVRREGGPVLKKLLVFRVARYERVRPK